MKKEHMNFKRISSRYTLKQFFLFACPVASPRSYGAKLYGVLFCLFSVFCLLSSADAKIYIDITDPGVRQIPLKIMTEGSPYANEVKWIAKNDLEKTGIFSFVAPGVPGAEVIAKIHAEPSDKLKIILTVTDLIENKELIKKKYEASKSIFRTVAHAVANDIYKAMTGQEGIFRTKLSYLVSVMPGRKELRMMDWDGYKSRKVVSKGLTPSHTWSRDGRFLLYSSERNRKWSMYRLDLNSYRESMIFSSKGLNLVGGVSPDGLVSFSSSRDGSSEIYVLDPKRKKMKKLTRSYGIDVSPAFSPDGMNIAFVSDRGGSPQIYIMNASGKGRPKRATYEGNYNTSPAWSPDGRSIAYVGRTNGKNQIFVVKFDGTDLRQLTNVGNNEEPSFSPDGYFIAFDSDREGTRGIYIMRADGEGQKRITPRYVNAVSPEWSPYLK
jgi:TolB protein